MTVRVRVSSTLNQNVIAPFCVFEEKWITTRDAKSLTPSPSPKREGS